MGDCVESLAEVKVDNIHSSPFVYPASHVIIESYQIGQAWFWLLLQANMQNCWYLLLSAPRASVAGRAGRCLLTVITSV